jgi:hypothetical protein
MTSASSRSSEPTAEQPLAGKEEWRQRRLTLTLEQRVAEEGRMIRAMSPLRFYLWHSLSRLAEAVNRLAAFVGPFPSPYD